MEASVWGAHRRARQRAPPPRPPPLPCTTRCCCCRECPLPPPVCLVSLLAWCTSDALRQWDGSRRKVALKQHQQQQRRRQRPANRGVTACTPPRRVARTRRPLFAHGYFCWGRHDVLLLGGLLLLPLCQRQAFCAPPPPTHTDAQGRGGAGHGAGRRPRQRRDWLWRPVKRPFPSDLFPACVCPRVRVRIPPLSARACADPLP